MARSTHTTRVLCATAAGLGSLLIGAQVSPDGETTGALQPPASTIAASAAASATAVPAPVPAASGAAPAVAAAASAARGPTGHDDRPITQSEAGSENTLSLARREKAIPPADGDPFAKLNWQPPPPPPPPAPPAPPPVAAAPPSAPPVPFGFVGLVEQGTGKPQAFLTKGDALLVVSAGDVIENNTYRVDSLSPASVVITYLPMGKQQTISVAGGSK